ncbi:MAG: hypothetical protein H0X30_13065 [Anaerolineae bacterium]|nr:hypothetical protein [Anaerolineae bacterium]
MTEQTFADRIQERYPEGLTGVFAIGGTRTTYVLEQNRQSVDPGRIDDFAVQGEYLVGRYWEFCKKFYDLGGQNMIITAFSFRGFYNRGAEYAEVVTQEMLRLIGENATAFYKEYEIDPYFVGIDTLLLLPPDNPAQQVAQQFAEYQRQWKYEPQRRKLLWEIASIPLYSFWDMYRKMSEAEAQKIDAELKSLANLEDINRALYRHFSRAVYGTDVPMPHFYLGTNKSGDLKWRSPMPLALSGGDYLRMFYTPYPSLFITQETMQAILENLAFKDRFYSPKTDYSGQYTTDLVQAEYNRVMELSANPETTVGLSRKVTHVPQPE